MSDIIPTEAQPRPLPFRRPADYYAAPPSEVRPLFPRWVPFGCGTASLLAIIVLAIGGAFAGSGRAGALFATLFATMEDELRSSFTKEVTPAERAAFDVEMKTLRANLAAGRVSIDRLQPFLQTIRDVSADNKVTPDEVEKLTRAAREVNRSAAQHATRNSQPAT